MEKIFFTPEGEEPVEFYVLEQTVIGGQNYILVTDAEDGDGEAWILKDNSGENDTEAIYEMVEDDKELEALGEIFRKLLDEDGVGLDF
ncbi:MAG: DUF1292 domain-containing protein [Butyrivibrio sp.]|nr:DUF1292 domain-containing protein [Butyrivibrio sp.]MBQ7429650.1 DUF1292 domain-containing protein [Butyrivibrio sp.]MCR4833066.1 DUF1292 domain-containing protein [Butyrivibrio sp.]